MLWVVEYILENKGFEYILENKGYMQVVLLWNLEVMSIQ